MKIFEFEFTEKKFGIENRKHIIVWYDNNKIEFKYLYDDKWYTYMSNYTNLPEFALGIEKLLDVAIEVGRAEEKKL